MGRSSLGPGLIRLRPVETTFVYQSDARCAPSLHLIFKERFFDNSPEYMREALEMSLRRLGVEHVDLYYVHRREPDRPIEEVMETLVGFK